MTGSNYLNFSYSIIHNLYLYHSWNSEFYKYVPAVSYLITVNSSFLSLWSTIISTLEFIKSISIQSLHKFTDLNQYSSSGIIQLKSSVLKILNETLKKW